MPPALRSFALLLLLCPPASADWRVVMHEGRRYVSVQNVAEFYKMAYQAAGGSEFRLAAPGRSIVGRAGARDLRINGVKYVLCFPVIQKNGQTLISAMDVTKIIEPVLRPQKIRNPTAVRTVVLDPGHGGHDSGARGLFGKEKDAALDVALRAKKLLEAQGYQVRMTRSTDVFVPLEERVRFANRFPNAVFVSIHFNKSRSAAGTGIETFCLAPRGVPSMDEDNLSYSDFKLHPGHARDPENIALATAVHAALVRRANLPDRGIKRARFHVIREAKIPAILVEGGFMNHPMDARLIATPVYRQQMAAAILAGVNAFRQAVGGQPPLPRPSAIASATDPTPVPSLANREIGTQTDASRAIEAAARAIAN